MKKQCPFSAYFPNTLKKGDHKIKWLLVHIRAPVGTAFQNDSLKVYMLHRTFIVLHPVRNYKIHTMVRMKRIFSLI